LCIIVETESDIQAFKDYVDTSEAVKSAKPSAPSKASAPSAPKPSTAAPPQPMATKSTVSSVGIGGRLFASPLARRLAAEKGIDLTALSGAGSGPGGRIRGADVLSAPIGVSGGPRALEFTDIVLTNMRQTIAKRLLQSKQTIPHYYLTVELEIDELLRYGLTNHSFASITKIFLFSICF
jgi:pyruvate dehydrogenase E2 component (dihydrolipoamide acetyltransferase)